VAAPIPVSCSAISPSGHAASRLLRLVPALWEALDEEGDTVMDAIHDVTRMAERRGINYRPIRARTAGQWLELRAEECRRYGISTLRAVDETPDDRKAWSRINDRDRKRAFRGAADPADRQAERERARDRRAAKGVMTRAQYRAEAAAKAEEWQAKGVSRATYYRHRKTGPSTPHPCDKSVRPSPSSLAESRTDAPVQAAAVESTNGHQCQRQGRKGTPEEASPARTVCALSPEAAPVGRQ
jgi:hypothetical protein